MVYLVIINWYLSAHGWKKNNDEIEELLEGRTATMAGPSGIGWGGYFADQLCRRYRWRQNNQPEDSVQANTKDIQRFIR